MRTLLQWVVAVFGMVVFIAAVVAVYYAISFLILRGVSAVLPLAGRRPRKSPRKKSDLT
jgi:hypothetical protein